MDTIFMNSKNSGTSESHVLLVKLTNELDLRYGKSVALSNLSIYCTWKNIKSSYNNNKFKISVPTWSEEFQLPDGSYLIFDIQEYFEHILKKYGESVDEPSIKIYPNKVKNNIIFKIKAGYYRELLTLETMRLLVSAKNEISKDENGEYITHLEVVDLVLVHCNLVNNDYHRSSSIIYSFVPNNVLGNILNIELKHKTYHLFKNI